MTRLFIVFLLLTSHWCRAQESLLLLKANKIITCDALNTTYKWVLLKDGIIKRLGNGAFKTNKKVKTIVYDGVIYPGFIDAHCHFAAYALDQYKCNLYNTRSFKEIVDKLKAYEIDNKRAYIYGNGWNQYDWDDPTLPNSKQLDTLFPNKPVILKRIDGHTILCNKKALELLRLTKIDNITYKNLLELDKNGVATGIIKEDLVEKLDLLISKQLPLKNNAALIAMEQYFFKNGIGGLVECGIDSTTYALEQELYRKGQLKIPNYYFTKYGFIPDNRQNKGDNFKFKGIKVFLDGTLGSKTACLLHNYINTSSKGTLLVDTNRLDTISILCYKNKWQLAVHAIGDSANRIALNTLGKYSINKDLRWRIEHAQVVDSSDFKLFNTYSIIPSVQPTHAISDHKWVVNMLGNESLETAYQYKKLLNSAKWMALGTDYPVEEINPIATFYSIVFGNGIKNKDNEMIIDTISRVDALKGMTIWAAKSVFEENNIGSIEIGKKANFTILSTDLLTDNQDKIKNTIVVSTIVNGKEVYKKRK